MSAATRRCFIHVGSPKTGTSYLQSVLWDSKPALLEHGLELSLRLRDHFMLTLALRGLLDETMDPPAAFTVLDRLGAALRRSTADTVLISHELLAPVSAERAKDLHDLLSDFDVHVLVTARDLARQVPAEWQQGVKHRSTRTYEAFLTTVVERRAQHFWAVQDVADVAARWRGSLPAERVHVVTVPQRGAPPGTLLERFCSVIGVDPAGLDTETARPNPSMGAQQAELLRRVNVALGDRLPHPRAGYARVAKNHLGDQVLAAQDGMPLRLPHRLDAWAQDTAREIIARVRSEGYTVVGDLDELLPVATAAGADLDDLDDVTALIPEEAVAASAVDAIAALLDQRHHDLEELLALRTRARRLERESLERPQPAAQGRTVRSVLRGLRERVAPRPG